MKRPPIILLILLACIFSMIPARATEPSSYGGTDAMSFWFDTDIAPGETFLTHYAKKQYRYIYKETTIFDSANNTYFMIYGSNADSNYPDFYGGVQQLGDGRRVALFTAWDLGKSNCEYFSCKPDDADPKNRIQLWAKGERTTSRRGGGEGTNLSSIVYDFNWQVGEKIAWLVSLEPAGQDSLLSLAARLGNKPWEFIASYIIPTRFKYGLGVGYGFIEDFGINTPFVLRSMSIGPTIAESADRKRDVITNVYVGSSQGKNRHKVSVIGSSVLGQVGTEPQVDAKADYRVRLEVPAVIPDYSDGKALLDLVVRGKSTRYQEELKKLEEEAAAKALAEANAKAEVEAKNKLEALEKAKLALKQNYETSFLTLTNMRNVILLWFSKYPQFWLTNPKMKESLQRGIEYRYVADPKQSDYEGLQDLLNGTSTTTSLVQDYAKSSSQITKLAESPTSKKITIVCVKGNSTKKVVGVNPKCPNGYKKR